LLFETYHERIYSIALHFSSNEAVAKDITQQVFLKLFTCIKQFHPDADFNRWLYRIVVNACLDEYRSHRRFILWDYAQEIKTMLVKTQQENNCLQHQIKDAVSAAIATLTPKLRLPIVLKYVEGLSYAEIAEILDCSMGTVASRLNRGHQLLARKLIHLRGLLELEE
jgi:RNA polymerase sigma-70 factor (ECF subfamily)